MEEKFLSKVTPGCYALKMLPLGHEEEFRTEVLVERETIILYEVVGYNKSKSRKRSLGYCFLYTGKPYVHDHTWYLAVCYSSKDKIGHKDWIVLYADHNVRLVRVGMGNFDYMFAYRGKTVYHDEQGFSDGAVRLETRDNWKDGL